MGLEGGGEGIANYVPDCLSFVQGPRTVLGNLTRWPFCKQPLGEADTCNFAEAWETSYRQFSERSGLGEGRGIELGQGAIANFGKGVSQGEGSYRRFSCRE